MTPRRAAQVSDWESLAPWTKAAQWREAAPEIASEVVALAKRHMEHQLKMSEEQAIHDRLMETRLWYTQIAATVASTATVLTLGVITAVTGDTANVASSLAVLGCGSGLAAGSFLASRGIRRAWLDERQRRQSAEQPAEELPRPATA